MRPDALLLAPLLSAILFTACAAPPEPAAPPAPQGVAPPSSAPAAAPKAAAASSLDARLQAIADEELDRTMSEARGRSGAVVVLDPATGEILANAGRAEGARADVGVRRTFVTGSTLKTITLAAALEEGAITLSDRFDCEQGARRYGSQVLHDAAPHGTLSVPEMLAVSTNVGFSKVYDRLGGARMTSWLRRFHFGAAPAIEGAATGDLPGALADGSFEGAVVAGGEWMKASPLQMAAAYAAIANGGAYVSPTLEKRRGAPAREVILKPETARALVTLLGDAVYSERATGRKAQVAGARVAGKTGTASWAEAGGAEGIYASFIGFLPADRPRYVILVGVENPAQPGATGGTIAAPTFARVASRALGL